MSLLRLPLPQQASPHSSPAHCSRASTHHSHLHLPTAAEATMHTCAYGIQVIDQFSTVFFGASALLLLLLAVATWQLLGFAWPLLFASGAVDPLDF